MLKRILLVTLAMTVFGFIDNAVMILVGDSIDKTIAQTFGFSMMASAGLGNTISDAFGAALGAMVPLGEDNLSLPWNILASVVGIMLGCLLGMIPLVWI